MLRLAFDGLPLQSEEALRHSLELLSEFLQEISEYFEAHLPKKDMIYGMGTVVEVRNTIEALLNEPNPLKKERLHDCLARLSIAAHCIPDDEQDVKT